MSDVPIIPLETIGKLKIKIKKSVELSMSDKIITLFDDYQKSVCKDCLSKDCTQNEIEIEVCFGYEVTPFEAGHKSRDEEIILAHNDGYEKGYQENTDGHMERTRDAETNAKIWQDENKRLEAKVKRSNINIEKLQKGLNHIIENRDNKIERLEADKDRLLSGYGKLQTKYNEIKAENKKLRKALGNTNKIIQDSKGAGFPINVPLRNQYKVNQQALKDGE